MISLDEDALICDFAETYQIYDYKALPPHLAAVLAAGLREDSRIKLKAHKQRLTNAEFLIAVVADRLGVLLAWLNGDKMPELLSEKAFEDRKKRMSKDKEVLKFKGPAEFEQARKKFIKEK